MNYLTTVAFAIFAGLAVSRVTKLLKLPNVSAFLIAGILIGPFLLGSLKIPGIGFHSLDDILSYTILRNKTNNLNQVVPSF